jgi:CheY-like chemotaxis protein
VSVPNPALACPRCDGAGRARHAHPFLGFACESCWGSGWRAAVWVRAVLGRGEKILVVDDSLAWLRIAREILTAGGYQAQTCEDPLEALSLLEQNPERIDLVITDLQMPGLDGIDLAAELLKINPTLPLVLLDADPLNDIHNTRRIVSVIRGGKSFLRAVRLRPSEGRRTRAWLDRSGRRDTDGSDCFAID